MLTPRDHSRRPSRPARPHRRTRLAVERLEDRVTPSTLIPAANHRDLVYDDSRGLLYVTTSTGQVDRYDAINRTLLSPYSVGVQLNGADITPDGSSLLVAEGQRGATQGIVRQVALDSGAVTNLSYNLGFGEGGAWDVATTQNGTALLTTRFEGSGFTNVRQINLSGGTFTTRLGVTQDVLLARDWFGRTVFGVEPNISTGPIFTYDAGSDSFPASAGTSGFLANALSSVSPKSDLVAMEFGGNVSILDRFSLQTIKVLPGLAGGVAFDPSRDILYAVNTSTNQVIAYDTNTWGERFRLDVGEAASSASAFGNGVMRVSGDGTKLFLATNSGIRLIDLPADTFVASRFVLTVPFSSYVRAGVAEPFTITAVDAAGNVAAGYAGTVHFTSSDPLAGLPTDYTFTGDDQGSHTFTAILNTAGTFTLTATDLGASFSVAQSGIRVHTDNTAVIPVANHRGLAIDPVHNILYIATSGGTVERYDVANQTLLAPLQVGGSLEGIDITADGGLLFIADATRGATTNFLHVLTPDGTFRFDLTYAATYAGAAGSYSVVVPANAKALFTSRFEGSGFVGLLGFDFATDSLSVRMGGITQDTRLFRSADGSLVFGLESNISSGPIFTYSAATDSFPHSAGTNAFLDNVPAGVNRNGTLVALELFGQPTSILNANLGTVQILPRSGGGLFFHPFQDVLFAVNTSTNQVIAYDTNTWTELYRLSVGESVGGYSAFGNGGMAVSADGTLLFLNTPTGVRVLQLPPVGGGGGAGAFGVFPDPNADRVAVAPTAPVAVGADQPTGSSFVPPGRPTATADVPSVGTPLSSDPDSGTPLVGWGIDLTGDPFGTRG